MNVYIKKFTDKLLNFTVRIDTYFFAVNKIFNKKKGKRYTYYAHVFVDYFKFYFSLYDEQST